MAIGVVGNGLPFWLIAYAEVRLPSNTTAILVACGPLFALIVSHCLTPDDRISARKLFGSRFGISRYTGRVDPPRAVRRGHPARGTTGTGDQCHLLRCRGNWARRLSLAPDAISAWAISWGAVALSLVWAQGGADLAPLVSPSGSTLAVIYLGIIPTALGFLIRYRQVLALGLTFSSFGGYLAPLFCALWSALILGEVLTPPLIIALLATFIGVVVSHPVDLRRMVASFEKRGRGQE